MRPILSLRSVLIESKVPAASDLKIAFASAIQALLLRFETHRFQLVVDFIEPLLKFRGFYLDARLAALTSDPSFGGVFEFPY